MKRGGRFVRGDPSENPNALHDFHKARRGPKNVPHMVMAKPNQNNDPKDPGHPYSKTENIHFEFYDQRTSNAPFGYEHFVSLPPAYEGDKSRKWPLILFLHGAGESQRGKNESFASIRHGIPKIILCYDRLKADPENTSPTISIPLAPRLRQSRQTKQGDKSVDPVSPDVCTMVAENFITVTPSLNMERGYGWNASILSALLDEVVERYQVDLGQIHVTGFSMGGYGTWELGIHSPNRFASLMPICGGGDRLRAGLIKHVPQWYVRRGR
jgi:predicted esterase